jgi:hypothetical protein
MKAKLEVLKALMQAAKSMEIEDAKSYKSKKKKPEPEPEAEAKTDEGAE